MSKHVDRALLLLKQSRTELAEEELRQALAGAPNDGRAHALLAICLAEREALDEATAEARMAIHLEPDLPFAHYVMASVLTSRHRLAEAEAAIEEALRLDPYDADYHAAKALIAYQRKRWQAAADAAAEGLAIDPDHIQCTNLRGMALVQLGRRAEAGRTIDAALARDPENALSHANQGWRLLHDRQPYPAMEHFREALRIDPTLEFARAGIVEAMKARNPIYRVLLGYFLWMARLDTRVQFALVLGLVFGQRILRSLVQQVPALAPLAPWILAAYLLFVVMTWTAYPLFNLLLRLNRFGRLALSREQTVASNFLGLTLLVALLACIAGPLIGKLRFDEFFLTLAVPGLVFAALAIPVSGTFLCRSGWPRLVMGGVALLLWGAAIGYAVLLWTAETRQDFDTALVWFSAAVWGIAASTWLGMILSAMPRPRR